jgi:hypothetical protein
MPLKANSSLLFTIYILVCAFFCSSSKLIVNNKLNKTFLATEQNPIVPVTSDTIYQDSTIIIQDTEGRPVQVIKHGQLIREYEYPSSKTVEVAEFKVKISRLKTEQFTYDFLAGDSVIVEVKAIRGGKFKKISFTKGESSVRAATYKTRKFTTSFHIDSAATYTLEINNEWGIRARFCKVSVKKTPKIIPRIYTIEYDTLIQVDTFTEVTSVDTVLVPLVDETMNVSAVLNIESSPFASTSFNLPIETDENGVFTYWAYWVGIGQNAIDGYMQLEDLEDWASENTSAIGVSAPLGAFSIGKLIPLGIGSGMVNNVDFAFTDQLNKNLFITGQDPKAVLFGTIGSNPSLYKKVIGMSYKIEKVFVSFKNKDAVNAFPIRFIAVGVKIIPKYGPDPKPKLIITSRKELVSK